MGCRLGLPGKSQLQIKDKPGPDKDQVKWKWNKGDATDVADFADPVSGTAQYHLCLYDTSVGAQPLLWAQVSPGGVCGRRDCWRATGSKGFKFGDRSGWPEGITSVKFKAGEAGRAQLQIRASGEFLTAPAPPLALDVTAQLVIEDGFARQCWQTEFSNSASNEPGKFRAKGP